MTGVTIAGMECGFHSVSINERGAWFKTQQFYLLQLVVYSSSSREAGQELQAGPEVETMEESCLLAMRGKHPAVLTSPVFWVIYFNGNFVFPIPLQECGPLL